MLIVYRNVRVCVRTQYFLLICTRLRVALSWTLHGLINTALCIQIQSGCRRLRK